MPFFFGISFSCMVVVSMGCISISKHEWIQRACECLQEVWHWIISILFPQMKHNLVVEHVRCFPWAPFHGWIWLESSLWILEQFRDVTRCNKWQLPRGFFNNLIKMPMSCCLLCPHPTFFLRPCPFLILWIVFLSHFRRLLSLVW